MSMEEIGRGDRGQNVRTWQLIMVRLGLKLDADGIFGRDTEEKTRQVQARAGLPVTGRVDAATWAVARLPDTAGAAPPLAPSHNAFTNDIASPRTLELITGFTEAQHYRKVPERAIRKIVLHTMEWAKKSNTAEACAAFFKKPGMRGTTPIIASAHICADVDSVIQCVPFRHVAFAAPRLNNDGIQIEQAGFARQSDAEWHDPYNAAMLANVAKLLAALSSDHDIPLERIPLDVLASNPEARGICTHHDGTLAFKIAGGHTDPGKGYPIDELLEQARAHL